MFIEDKEEASVVDDPASSAGEDNDSQPGAGEAPAGDEKITMSKSDLERLNSRLDSLEGQNKGLVRDLREERKRRQAGMRSNVQNFAEPLKFNDEDKKNLEIALAGENPVDTIVGIVQKVVFHEWGKYTTHQACVGELMERHPDMFDERGRYNPKSEKGKLWEQIAAADPKLKDNPEGVRLAMERLEEMVEAGGGSKPKKSKAKAEEAEEEEVEEEEAEEEAPAPRPKPHVGSGGRKPLPAKKSGPLSKTEADAARRYKMTDEQWNKSKNNKVIEADV